MGNTDYYALAEKIGERSHQPLTIAPLVRTALVVAEGLSARLSDLDLSESQIRLFCSLYLWGVLTEGRKIGPLGSLLVNKENPSIDSQDLVFLNSHRARQAPAHWDDGFIQCMEEAARLLAIDASISPQRKALVFQSPEPECVLIFLSADTLLRLGWQSVVSAFAAEAQTRADGRLGHLRAPHFASLDHNAWKELQSAV